MNPHSSSGTDAPVAACSQHGSMANSNSMSLDNWASGVLGEVVVVNGDGALAAQLSASGLWPGARIERIASAPFGGPLLFRLHGYRLALRRDEAARVQVRPIPDEPTSGEQVDSKPADSKPVASE